MFVLDPLLVSVCACDCVTVCRGGFTVEKNNHISGIV